MFFKNIPWIRFRPLDFLSSRLGSGSEINYFNVFLTFFFQEQKNSIFSMLYNFPSGGSSSENDKTATPTGPEPTKTLEELYADEPAEATPPAAWSEPSPKSAAVFARDMSEFDAYVYDHDVRKTAVPAALSATSRQMEQTQFTPTELKMLLFNYKNLSSEEQETLREYVRLYGLPKADNASSSLFSRCSYLPL